MLPSKLNKNSYMLLQSKTEQSFSYWSHAKHKYSKYKINLYLIHCHDRQYATYKMRGI